MENFALKDCNNYYGITHHANNSAFQPYHSEVPRTIPGVETIFSRGPLFGPGYNNQTIAYDFNASLPSEDSSISSVNQFANQQLFILESPMAGVPLCSVVNEVNEQTYLTPAQNLVFQQDLSTVPEERNSDHPEGKLFSDAIYDACDTPIESINEPATIPVIVDLEKKICHALHLMFSNIKGIKDDHLTELLNEFVKLYRHSFERSASLSFTGCANEVQQSAALRFQLTERVRQWVHWFEDKGVDRTFGRRFKDPNSRNKANMEEPESNGLYQMKMHLLSLEKAKLAAAVEERAHTDQRQKEGSLTHSEETKGKDEESKRVWRSDRAKERKKQKELEELRQNSYNDADGQAQEHVEILSKYKAKCHSCSYRFTETRYVTVHEKYFHKKIYYCHYCSRTFATHGPLRVHCEQAHTGLPVDPPGRKPPTNLENVYDSLQISDNSRTQKQEVAGSSVKLALDPQVSTNSNSHKDVGATAQLISARKEQKIYLGNERQQIFLEKEGCDLSKMHSTSSQGCSGEDVHGCSIVQASRSSRSDVPSSNTPIPGTCAQSVGNSKAKGARMSNAFLKRLKSACNEGLERAANDSQSQSYEDETETNLQRNLCKRRRTSSKNDQSQSPLIFKVNDFGRIGEIADAHDANDGGFNEDKNNEFLSMMVPQGRDTNVSCLAYSESVADFSVASSSVPVVPALSQSGFDKSHSEVESPLRQQSSAAVVCKRSSTDNQSTLRFASNASTFVSQDLCNQLFMNNPIDATTANGLIDKSILNGTECLSELEMNEMNSLVTIGQYSLPESNQTDNTEIELLLEDIMNVSSLAGIENGGDSNSVNGFVRSSSLPPYGVVPEADFVQRPHSVAGVTSYDHEQYKMLLEDSIIADLKELLDTQSPRSLNNVRQHIQQRFRDLDPSVDLLQREAPTASSSKSKSLPRIFLKTASTGKEEVYILEDNDSVPPNLKKMLPDLNKIIYEFHPRKQFSESPTFVEGIAVVVTDANSVSTTLKMKPLCSTISVIEGREKPSSSKNVKKEARLLGIESKRRSGRKSERQIQKRGRGRPKRSGGKRNKARNLKNVRKSCRLAKT